MGLITSGTHTNKSYFSLTYLVCWLSVAGPETIRICSATVNYIQPGIIKKLSASINNERRAVGTGGRGRVVEGREPAWTMEDRSVDGQWGDSLWTNNDGQWPVVGTWGWSLKDSL